MVRPEYFPSFVALIECQNPTTDLYKFLGTLKLYNASSAANGHPADSTDSVNVTDGGEDLKTKKKL